MMGEKGEDDASRFPRWFIAISSWRGVFAVFVVYGLAHGLVARLVGPGLAMDDGKLNVVTQSLRAGYMPSNPPLFEWLLIAVQQLTGPSLLSFLIVKYVLMALCGLCVYGGAKMAGASRAWAALTAFSLVLFFQFAWRYHQAFTHSLVLIAATFFFWFVFLRLLHRQSIVGFALLGVAIGVGLLSKYSFLGVLIAALLAAALRPLARRAIFAPAHGGYLALAFAIAGLIAAPHLLWLVSDNQQGVVLTAERLQGADAPYWRRLLSGLPMAVWAIISFFLPFALVAVSLFYSRGGKGAGVKASPSSIVRALRHVLARSHLAKADLNEGAALARMASVLGAMGMIGGVIALGMDGMQERYAIGFLAPALFWVMGAGEARAPSRRRLSIYLAALIAFAGIFMGMRLVQAAAPGQPFCKACRQWIPYEPLRDELIALGFDGQGTLAGVSDNTAGNLRRLFPKARIFSGQMPFYRAPLNDSARGDQKGAPACYLIWSNHEAPGAVQAFGALLGDAPLTQFEAPWRHFLKPDDWRYTEWSIAELSSDSDLGRRFCGA